MTVTFNFFEIYTDRKTIFYKKMVIDFAESIGETKFFELTHHYFVNSPLELRKWKADLDGLMLPQNKTTEISDKIWHDGDALKIQRLLNLVRKNRFRKPHYNAHLGTDTAKLLQLHLSGRKLNKADIQHLVFFGLIDTSHNLTEYAHHYHLADSKLSVQARHLEIIIEGLKASRVHSRAELTVKAHLLATTGLKWLWIENDLYHYFYKKLLGSIYEQLGFESWHGSLEVIARDMEEEFVASFTKEYFDDYVNTIEKCKRKDKSIWLSNGENLSIDETQDIYTSLGFDFFLNILRKDLEMPGPMTMGWPDLLGWGNGRYEFVEVKQNDKFTFGQLRTLPFLKQIESPFRIIKLL